MNWENVAKNLCKTVACGRILVEPPPRKGLVEVFLLPPRRKCFFSVWPLLQQQFRCICNKMFKVSCSTTKGDLLQTTRNQVDSEHIGSPGWPRAPWPSSNIARLWVTQKIFENTQVLLLSDPFWLSPTWVYKVLRQDIGHHMKTAGRLLFSHWDYFHRPESLPWPSTHNVRNIFSFGGVQNGKSQSGFGVAFHAVAAEAEGTLQETAIVAQRSTCVCVGVRFCACTFTWCILEHLERPAAVEQSDKTLDLQAQESRHFGLGPEKTRCIAREVARHPRLLVSGADHRKRDSFALDQCGIALRSASWNGTVCLFGETFILTPRIQATRDHFQTWLGKQSFVTVHKMFARVLRVWPDQISTKSEFVEKQFVLAKNKRGFLQRHGHKSGGSAQMNGTWENLTCLLKVLLKSVRS